MRHDALALAGLLVLVACDDSGGAAPARPPDGTPLSGHAARSLVPAPVFSACGAPTVDGLLSPGEWDDAVSTRFLVVRPASAGGGMVPAVLRAMSDDHRLYFAVEIEADTSGFSQSHFLMLDVDRDGAVSAGDDVFGFTYWTPLASGGVPGGTTAFFDDFYAPCVLDGLPALCGPEDVDPLPGMGPAGTVDGGAALSFGAASVVEEWHPYDGVDLRDLRAVPGETIAMQLDVRLLDACADYPRCYGDTGFPSEYTYRDFVVGCGGPRDEEVITVRIDVKPGDTVPTIHLGAGGTTAVAILGGRTFDVATVDLDTVYFAGAPVARRQDGSRMAAVEDSNGDGRPDLLCHFETAALRLTAASTEATLAGATTAGVLIRGTDAVRVTR